MDWKGLLREALDHDRLNWWVLDLLGKEITTDAQTVVDIALEYMSCGEYRDAQRLFMKAVEEERDRPILGNPTVTALAYYYLAYCEAASADILTEEYLTQAREADTTWTFPGRRSDAAVLEWASERAPRDAVARRLLGHWLYGVDRHQAAWRAWNSAVTIRDDDPITRRNLGIAAVNIHNDLQTATEQFERALELSPDDAKLWQERDQLAYISGEAASQRLARLDRVKYLVNDRDDLTVAYAELLTLCGKANEALELLSGRHFHPWEGGEGKVLRAWENANLYLARSALAQASKTAGEDNHELLEQALTYVKSAVDTPKNLGEARHPLANQAELLYAFGEVYKAMGLRKQAEEYWKQAAQQNGDFLDMAVSEYSIKSIFQALALERLGKTPESKELLEKIVTYADKLGSTPGQIPYFATSLPTMLLFHTNLDQNNRIEAAKLLAWARALLGDAIRATEHLTFLKHSVPSDPEVVLVDKAVSATT